MSDQIYFWFQSPGFSILVSVVVTVILMCLRESNKRSLEEAEKEEAELLEELGSSEEDMWTNVLFQKLNCI